MTCITQSQIIYLITKYKSEWGCVPDDHRAKPKQEPEQSSQAWPTSTGIMLGVWVSSVRLLEDASQLLPLG